MKRVISDTHFNHASIIRYTDRPFRDVAEMNEAMIAAWNSVVTERDEVWHLGDFGFPRRGDLPTLGEIFARLNGVKFLIRGNHDRERMRKDDEIALDLPWDAIEDYAEIRDEGVRYVLSHYPMETWRNAARNWVMLHGHCHGTLKRVIGHRFDVGVDPVHKMSLDEEAWTSGWVTPWAPVPFLFFGEWAKLQTFEAADHHGD
jgi:calcineurin-like phosphoesterase family protein